MTVRTSAPEQQRSVLPQLEALLVDAAAKRVPTRRRWSPRWPVIVVAASLLTAGAAAAGTGVLSRGDSEQGSYVIEQRAAPSSGDSARNVCLQLRVGDKGPAYGCGAAPSAKRPFGLVIADSLGASSERVIYGLVDDAATTVRALGTGDAFVDAPTESKANVPGRYFHMTAPNTGRIELVALSRTGSEIGRIGSRKTPNRRPLSQDEAIAQGDPAGFAPGIPTPGSFTYNGRSIKPDDAARRGLACVQDRSGVRCADSIAQLDARQTPRQTG